MRVIFFSNYYPPTTLGGYEMWCYEVANDLVNRKHHVAVVTSAPQDLPSSVNENGVQVHRTLHNEVVGGVMDTVKRLIFHRDQMEAENLRLTRQIIAEFTPDCAVIWGMWNIPRSVPYLVEELLTGRVVYYICDYWLTLPSAYIQKFTSPSSRSITSIPKYLLGRPFLWILSQNPPAALKLEHPICVSHAVKSILINHGISMENGSVIPGGTQIEEYKSIDSHRSSNLSNGELRLLYAGRLSPEKGVHTIIKALDKLPNDEKHDIKLNIYGQGSSNYMKYLKDLKSAADVNCEINFHPFVPHQQMTRIFSQHDILIFPSEWDEPFARTVLEAMAAGLTVIGTTTGGTSEILANNETGLTFPAGDSSRLAAQISYLLHNPKIRQQISKNGKKVVEEHYTFQKMVNLIEQYLFAINS